MLPDSVYFFIPSTQSCMLEMVPVTVAEACTDTGELTLEPLAGLQMWTPAEDGAVQAVEVGTTASAFGVAAMVNGDPGTAVMLLDVTVYT